MRRWLEAEQSRLMVFARANGPVHQQPRLIHSLLVNGAFKHQLQQTPPSPSTSYFHQSSRPREPRSTVLQPMSADVPDITLELSQHDEKYELRVAAQHSVIVQSLVKELRRLGDVIRECGMAQAGHRLTSNRSLVHPEQLAVWVVVILPC